VERNKIRRSRREDPLSLESVMSKDKVREDEKYFVKFFEEKKKRVENKKALKKSMGLEDWEGEGEDEEEMMD
jgi:hypothetical protein